MNGALVSAIVPVFNGERFLAAALESIFAQDYQPVEVIVVDDGSVDGTADAARSFNRVHYLWQVNQGVASARNAGIAVAHGAFLTFPDADDLMAPTKFSAQVGYLLSHPAVGCVLTRQEVFFEPGVTPPPWVQRDLIFGDAWGVGPLSMMARRDVIERVGGFDPRYVPADGMEWLGRLREHGIGIAVLPEILMHRRIHEANTSYQNKAMVQGLLKSLKRKLDSQRARASSQKSGES
jgi:glycosyltransferase involved in cell wall biosynthesis